MPPLPIPPEVDSPLARVRKGLERIEAGLTNLRGAGQAEAVALLTLLDQAAEGLERLEEAGADVRAERGRMEAAWQRLQRQARLFLQEAGPALAAERARRSPPPHHPWWFLDRTFAQAQRRLLARRMGGILLALLLGLLAWALYDRFIAPPPNVRQSLEQYDLGRERAAAGDLPGALAAFEAAAELTPDDPDPLLWVGVLRQTMGDEEGAQTAYAGARDLGLDGAEFLFQRGMLFIEAGNLEAARSDANALLETSPSWGHAFFLRASVEEAAGEFAAAADDYARAAELAHEAGDVELEATARVRLGLMIQYQDASPAQP